MRKIGIMALILTVALLMGATGLFANPMGTPSQQVFFKLNTTQAFIQDTRPDPAESQADIMFSLRDTDGSHAGTMLTNVSFAILVDRTKLAYWGATVIGSSFTGRTSLYRPDPTSNFDTVYIELYGGNAAVPSTYTDFLELTFSVLCQDESSVDPVNFCRSTNLNFITLTGLPTQSPIDENYTDGSVTVADYHADFAIRLDTVIGGTGAIAALPVKATTSALTGSFYHLITFDGDKLRLDSIPHIASLGYVFTDVRQDTLTFFAMNGTSMPLYTNDTLYTLYFTALCDLPQAGMYSSVLFAVDSCTYSPAHCSMNPNPSYVGGFTKLGDTAALTASLQGTDNLLRRSAPRNVFWDISMANSFAAGISSLADKGISLNLKTGSANLTVPSTYATSGSALKWSSSTPSVDAGNVYQVYDAAYTNCLPASGTPQSLVTLRTVWDTIGYVPSWAGRFIRPAFIDDFAVSPEHTVVPDCQSPQCFKADSTNTMLKFGPFGNQLEVVLAEFSSAGYTSTNACTYFDIKVRNNFVLDSFMVDVSVPLDWCLNNVTNVRTGVTVTYPNANTVRFKTNSAFDPMSVSANPVAFARVHVGKNLSCSMKPRYFSVATTMSHDSAWEAGGVLQFSAKSNGAASARCIPPGNNCCDIVHQEDPIGGISKPDDGLPREFALDQNYPNPFNPTTTISLDLPKASDWTITVFNITGQVIKTYSGYSGPGRVQVEFDGSQVASGVYLYRAEAGEFRATKKMVLMK